MTKNKFRSLSMCIWPLTDWSWQPEWKDTFVRGTHKLQSWVIGPFFGYRTVKSDGPTFQEVMEKTSKQHKKLFTSLALKEKLVLSDILNDTIETTQMACEEVELSEKLVTQAREVIERLMAQLDMSEQEVQHWKEKYEAVQKADIE